MKVGVFSSILKETTKHGMEWNVFSPAEENQVAKIACQENADLFFSMLLELSSARLFLKAPQSTVTIIEG
jgi:hypothetical protein